jgi:hypothetical protein
MPQAAEWQHVGNQIDAAMIFAPGGLRKREWRLLVTSADVSEFWGICYDFTTPLL